MKIGTLVKTIYGTARVVKIHPNGGLTPILDLFYLSNNRRGTWYREPNAKLGHGIAFLTDCEAC
jgi:hypothetical protein